MPFIRPTRTALAALLLSLILSALAPLGVVATAHAQATGGSFGGGDFSNSGSSGSSGSSGGSWGGSGGSDWSSSSSSSGSSYSGDSSGKGAAGGAGSFCMCVMICLALVVYAIVSKKKGGAAAVTGGQSYVGATGGMFLSQLTLGIDWRARKELQEQLSRLAASGATGTKEGRAMLLRETVLALRRAEIAWLYAAYKDSGPPLGGPQAQAAFQGAASEARARFRQEIVRAADGSVVQNPTPEMRAKATEGQGTVVVSLIIVARRGLTAVTNLNDANQIRGALQERGSLDAESLVALEVVWSPAVENDRMSTAELEQNYPELRLIDPASIAGRLFCKYCNGPFAMELLNCPHCGAPAPKVEQGEAQGAGPAPLGGGQS